MSGSSTGTPASAVNEPITLAEAQDHLRVDTYGSPEIAEDAELILDKLAQAREYCEQFTGLAMASRSVEVVLDAEAHMFLRYTKLPFTRVNCASSGIHGTFPNRIELPLSPARSITSVVHVDSDGNETTIDSDEYWLNTKRLPSVLRPKNGAWTVTGGELVITYEAGYESGALPKTARGAILLMLGHLYDQRSNSAPIKIEEIPAAAEALLRPLRLKLGMA